MADGVMSNRKFWKQSNLFLHQNGSITMNISIVVNGNIMEDEQKLTNEFNLYNYINIAKTTSGKPQGNYKITLTM